MAGCGGNLAVQRIVNGTLSIFVGWKVVAAVSQLLLKVKPLWLCCDRNK
jgi:hypothetical protein